MDVVETPVTNTQIPPQASTLVWYEELELEEGDGSMLGDTQNARIGHGVADIRIGRTSLTAICVDLAYGTHNSLGACHIMLDFTIRSDTEFRLKSADLICQVGNESTISSSTSSNDIIRPMILKCAPPEISDDNPTTIGIERTKTIMPEVDVANAASVGGVGYVRRKTYNETWGWHMDSSIGSSAPHTSTTSDVVMWTFTANRMQRDRDVHTFTVEALIRHDDRPFFADFTLEARLVFGGMVRTIGRKKKITNRRHFVPVASTVVFP